MKSQSLMWPGWEKNYFNKPFCTPTVYLNFPSDDIHTSQLCEDSPHYHAPIIPVLSLSSLNTSAPNGRVPKNKATEGGADILHSSAGLSSYLIFRRWTGALFLVPPPHTFRPGLYS